MFLLFIKNKKVFAGIGLALFLAPAIFLAAPKKAEAIVPVHDMAWETNFATWAAAWGSWAGQDIARWAPALTPGLPTNIYQNIAALKMKEVGVTAAGLLPIPFTSWDSIAYTLGKALLRALTQSIVTWIRTGFQGGPLFITSLQNHLTDAADQATGMFMKQFLSNEVLGSICSPWQNQLKLALSNLAYKSQSKRYSCTLNTVIGNATNFYNNFNQGGWGAWVTVAGSNSNSPYELYLTSQSRLLSAISSGQSRAGTESIFNNGFISMKKCVEYYADEWTGPGPEGRGICIRYETTSPGKWVQTQLSEATGIDFHELNMADEINEIISALIQQGISYLFSTIAQDGGITGDSAGGYGRRATSTPPAYPSDPIPPPNPITQCSDGIDNDADGLTDMADPDCSSSDDNDEGRGPVVPPGSGSGTNWGSGSRFDPIRLAAPIPAISSYGADSDCSDGTFTDCPLATEITIPRGDRMWFIIDPMLITGLASNPPARIEITIIGGPNNVDAELFRVSDRSRPNREDSVAILGPAGQITYIISSYSYLTYYLISLDADRTQDQPMTIRWRPL